LPANNPALYVSSVLTLYVDLPDTPLRANTAGANAEPRNGLAGGFSRELPRGGDRAAKKLTLGPQNVLSQAERYARGLSQQNFSWGEYGVPFLYSTNGEVIWHHDVRDDRNRSRWVEHFHTPEALRERLGRDEEAALARVLGMAQQNARLRPYQGAASRAIEDSLLARRRVMLVAMATGTGKTFTLVNEIHCTITVRRQD
jgi:type I site-specific restriction endonuclease